MDDNLTTTMTKWTTSSSKEDEEEDQPPEVPFRSWTTHYADWNLQNGCGGDEHLPDYLFHQSTNADQLFRQFVGKCWAKSTLGSIDGLNNRCDTPVMSPSC